MKLCTTAIVCLLSMMLSGCSYSTTAHQFEFYGSTQESFGRDFFYVKYGVTGAATATYTARGGGFVREGLIADAKRELIASHPLGPNQSYVNMSVDITQTQTGGAYGESVYVSKIDLTATISADVIQFGQPPVDYAIPVASRSGQIGGVSLKTSSGLSIGLDFKRLDELIESGEAFFVRYGGAWYEGKLLKYGKTASGGDYCKVEFPINGRTKTGMFSSENVSFERPAEEDE